MQLRNIESADRTNNNSTSFESNGEAHHHGTFCRAHAGELVPLGVRGGQPPGAAAERTGPEAAGHAVLHPSPGCGGAQADTRQGSAHVFNFQGT